MCDLLGKRTCCESKRSQVQILSTHIKARHGSAGLNRQCWLVGRDKWTPWQGDLATNTRSFRVCVKINTLKQSTCASGLCTLVDGHTQWADTHTHTLHIHTNIHVGGRKESGGGRGLKGAGGQAKCKNNGIHERRKQKQNSDTYVFKCPNGAWETAQQGNVLALSLTI